jgi:hypothetical protein
MEEIEDGTTVTISNAGLIGGSESFETAEQLKPITDIVNTTVTLKSAAATKAGVSFVINVSADGEVTWSGAENTPADGSAKLIADLQAGKAS